MKIFAIADLHLSLGSDKPMDVFGNHWKDHHLRIERDWTRRVGPDDLVLLPGDHSWGLKLSEAIPDLAFIASLPGHKVLLKGNHDLWWQSRTKVESVLDPSMKILQNDALQYGEWNICGTRGWISPIDETLGPDDEKVYRRELLRLRMSLDAADPTRPTIAMLHYPPVSAKGEPTAFADMLAEYHVSDCVYGHLHGEATRGAFEGEVDGVRYSLVSADHLRFRLKRIF